MNEGKFVQTCLDLGEAMINWGAEIWRVEDSLHRIFDSYGFVRCDVWAIATNMQVTVETPKGNIITQTRTVHSSGTDYDKLNHLNDLCRYICQFTPDEKEISGRLQKIKERKEMPKAAANLIMAFSAAAFTVLFGGNASDAVTTALASLVMLAAGGWLGKREKNPVIYNVILAFLGEVVVLGALQIDPGLHPDPITIGIVMLLVSGLRLTNGIRDLLHKDTFTGILNITTAVTGAAGIACGIALALVLFGSIRKPYLTAHSSVVVQLIASTLGCTGFGVYFGMRGKQLATSGAGAFWCFAIYLIVLAVCQDDFPATMMAALFVSGYAFILARIHKAPATLFLTLCVFPVIPGSKLYYTMYGMVCRDPALVAGQSQDLLRTCIAIVFGFMAGDIIQHYLTVFLSWWKKIEYRHL